jgi:hypothetical protein
LSGSLQWLKSAGCNDRCDVNNARFFVSPNAKYLGQICTSMANELFLSCRTVQWKDDLQYMFGTATNFTDRALHLKVSDGCYDHELTATEVQ